MRDIDRRVTIFVVQATHFETHLLTQVGVEIRQRLIEQQRFRLDDQRAGERDALLLAAGQLAGIAVGQGAELRRRQHGLDLLRDRAAIELSQFQPIRDIVGDRHVWPQRVALEDHRHVAPLRRHSARRRRYEPVADIDLAGRRFDEPGDQAQRRSLTAARRAQQANQAAVVDMLGNVVDDGQPAVALRQSSQLDRRHAFTSCRIGLSNTRTAAHCRDFLTSGAALRCR